MPPGCAPWERTGPKLQRPQLSHPSPRPPHLQLGNSTLWTLPPLPSDGQWLTSVDLKDQIQKFKLAGSSSDSDATNAGAAAALGSGEDGETDPSADTQPQPSPSPANPFIDPGNSDKVSTLPACLTD